MLCIVVFLFFLLFCGEIRGGLLMQLSRRRCARSGWVGVKESPRVVIVLRCPKMKLQLIASNTYMYMYICYISICIVQYRDFTACSNLKGFTFNCLA